MRSANDVQRGQTFSREGRKKWGAYRKKGTMFLFYFSFIFILVSSDPGIMRLHEEAGF